MVEVVVEWNGMSVSSMTRLMCAAGANMCKNNADFKPFLALDEDGELTCADISDAFFDRIPGGASTWADVTCSNMMSPREAEDQGTTLWPLTQHAESCCGGRDKVRCFDSSTMCINSADFEPDTEMELANFLFSPAPLLLPIPSTMSVPSGHMASSMSAFAEMALVSTELTSRRP